MSQHLKTRVCAAGMNNNMMCGTLYVTKPLPVNWLEMTDEDQGEFAQEQANAIVVFLSNTVPFVTYDALSVLMAEHARKEGLL